SGPTGTSTRRACARPGPPRTTHASTAGTGADAGSGRRAECGRAVAPPGTPIQMPARVARQLAKGTHPRPLARVPAQRAVELAQHPLGLPGDSPHDAREGKQAVAAAAAVQAPRERQREHGIEPLRDAAVRELAERALAKTGGRRHAAGAADPCHAAAELVLERLQLPCAERPQVERLASRVVRSVDADCVSHGGALAGTAAT